MDVDAEDFLPSTVPESGADCWGGGGGAQCYLLGKPQAGAEKASHRQEIGAENETSFHKAKRRR